jgi:hypothetical protein
MHRAEENARHPVASPESPSFFFVAVITIFPLVFPSPRYSTLFPIFMNKFSNDDSRPRNVTSGDGKRAKVTFSKSDAAYRSRAHCDTQSSNPSQWML